MEAVSGMDYPEEATKVFFGKCNHRKNTTKYLSEDSPCDSSDSVIIITPHKKERGRGKGRDSNKRTAYK